MTKPFTTLASITLVGLLGGCGSPSTDTTAKPAAAVKSDVIVSLDGKRHVCLVALNSEAQGSEVPCTELAAFVKDELRMPAGASYDIRTLSTVDAAEVASVKTMMTGAGYHFAGESASK